MEQNRTFHIQFDVGNSNRAYCMHFPLKQDMHHNNSIAAEFRPDRGYLEWRGNNGLFCFVDYTETQCPTWLKRCSHRNLPATVFCPEIYVNEPLPRSLCPTPRESESVLFLQSIDHSGRSHNCLVLRMLALFDLADSMILSNRPISWECDLWISFG